MLNLTYRLQCLHDMELGAGNIRELMLDVNRISNKRLNMEKHDNFSKCVSTTVLLSIIVHCRYKM